MNIIYTYSLYEPCLINSKYWINYFIEKGANDWNYGLRGACLGGNLDIVNTLIEKGAKPPKEYRIPFKVPKDNRVIEIIYVSLYDYLPDEMIDIILKYSIVENFNLSIYSL